MNTPEHPWNPASADQPSHTRRNVVVGMSTLSAVVLAMGYHTSLDAQSAGSGATTTTVAAGGAAGTGSAGAGPGADAVATDASGGSAGTSSGAGASGTLKDGTYTGSSATTRWGPVQVRITVSGGKMTTAQAVQYPRENAKDVQINARAVPTYNSEAVAAQSAQIDAVSGATVTWQGYTTSLQSALDQARA